MTPQYPCKLRSVYLILVMMGGAQSGDRKHQDRVQTLAALHASLAWVGTHWRLMANTHSQSPASAIDGQVDSGPDLTASGPALVLCGPASRFRS